MHPALPPDQPGRRLGLLAARDRVIVAAQGVIHQHFGHEARHVRCRDPEDEVPILHSSDAFVVQACVLEALAKVDERVEVDVRLVEHHGEAERRTADPGRADRAVAVPPVDPVLAVRRGCGGGFREGVAHPGEVTGVPCVVRIEVGDDWVMGVEDAVVACCGRAPMRSPLQHHPLREVRRDPLGEAVLRPIVDDDQLPPLVRLGEHALDSPPDQMDSVPDRHDDAEHELCRIPLNHGSRTPLVRQWATPRAGADGSY